MANDTPTRPWLIYAVGELYGDFKTETDREKAQPRARNQEKRSCSPSGRPIATTAQAGPSPGPGPEHEPRARSRLS